MILRRRGLVTRIIIPISLILATWSRSYVEALMGTRYRGPATSKEAHTGVNRWVALFATACTRAVAGATAHEERMIAVEKHWRRRLGSVRANSSVDLILRALPGAPILSVNGAAGLLAAASWRLTVLSSVSSMPILQQVKVGRRNRVFEAPDIIAAFTDLERQLASPEGDTRSHLRHGLSRIGDPENNRIALTVWLSCGALALPQTKLIVLWYNTSLCYLSYLCYLPVCQPMSN